MTKKRCLVALTVFLFIGAVVGVFFVLSIGRFLDVSPPLERADA